MSEHFDVLVVGAGLSGVGAGYHLQKHCAAKRYAILEAREAIGGTWDLFRYPGVRSDSDMFTLGYSFRPWREARAIADGPAILAYVRATAREFGIDRRIRFQHRVTRASWSSAHARWTVDAEVGPEGDNSKASYTCNFLYLCSGYYSYEKGHAPQFPGSEAFEGALVHPQHWPEALDYAGKQVVVIGSGATAVTLVPAMAQKAAHVTMLQRSPSYIVTLPAQDRVADRLRALLPGRLADRVVRWKNVLRGLYFYQVCRRAPRLAMRAIRKGAQMQLPAGYPVDTHFKPSYEPWDQRLCVAPDGDLFKAISAGRASIVTDHIERFSEHGIRLRSGRELPADVVVAATGLRLLPCGGIQLEVDGRRIETGKTFGYKGVMLSNVPNLAICIGYTNSSWTLRADLSSRYLCRLLNHMDRHGYLQATPRRADPAPGAAPMLDLKSGYIQRGLDLLPKQGEKAPWKVAQNYVVDLMRLELGAVDDGALEFSRAARS